MSLKKQSISKEIRIFISIIFILSIVNYVLTNRYNNKVFDCQNKIILIDEILSALKQINIDNVSETDTEKMNRVRSLFAVLKSGGKSDVFFIKNKISPANENMVRTFPEIEKKLAQSEKILRAASETNVLLPKQKQSLFEENRNFFNLRLLKLKKALRKKMKSAVLTKDITDAFSLLFIVLAAFFAYYKVKNKLSENIEELNSQLRSLFGEKKYAPFHGSAEFETLSGNISSINEMFEQISLFVNNLLSDNYNVKFNAAGKKNPVEPALIALRNKLKENIEINQKRLEEERKRQWFSESRARFNDILRESGQGIKKLAESSLINMVKFLQAAQGGFFVVNDNETQPFLELLSAFAYDRIKLLSKRIEFGDGLVGMCAVEQNTIVVTDVPDGYMQIESGLGEASPTNILIIPLKTEENILGVIEIASFNDFKKSEIEFIENIAELIAKTLETTKISAKTAELLQESRKKSDELAQRDTEMSEKISELQEAQKETKRSASEINALTDVLDKVLLKAELSTAGKINSLNTFFLNSLGYAHAEVRNKLFSDFVPDDEKKVLKKIIAEIENKNFIQQEINFITKENLVLATKSFFSAIRDEKGKIERILLLADNTSYRNELQQKNELLHNELQEKVRIIQEKEKEISSVFAKANFADDKTEKLKKREENILKKHESRADKKYYAWLEDIKNNL